MMTDALGQIASTGVMGVLLVIALIALYLKDKQLGEETEARIKDGQETQKLLMQVQQSAIDTTHKLSEVADRMEKREEDMIRESRGRL